MNADMIVGERIHLELFRRRLTQRMVAKQLGMSEQTFGKKLTGRSTFTLDELLLVSRWLELSMDDLLPGPNYEPPLGCGRDRRGRVRHHPVVDEIDEPCRAGHDPAFEAGESPACSRCGESL